MKSPRKGADEWEKMLIFMNLLGITKNQPGNRAS